MFSKNIQIKITQKSRQNSYFKKNHFPLCNQQYFYAKIQNATRKIISYFAFHTIYKLMQNYANICLNTHSSIENVDNAAKM